MTESILIRASSTVGVQPHLLHQSLTVAGELSCTTKRGIRRHPAKNPVSVIYSTHRNAIIMELTKGIRTSQMVRIDSANACRTSVRKGSGLGDISGFTGAKRKEEHLTKF